MHLVESIANELSNPPDRCGIRVCIVNAAARGLRATGNKVRAAFEMPHKMCVLGHEFEAAAWRVASRPADCGQSRSIKISPALLILDVLVTAARPR